MYPSYSSEWISSKSLLTNHQQHGSGSSTLTNSPFLDKTSLMSTNFIKINIRELLNQYSSNNNFEIDVNNITLVGYLFPHLWHKGLISICCFYHKSIIMVGKHKLSLDGWNKETYNLPTFRNILGKVL